MNGTGGVMTVELLITGPNGTGAGGVDTNAGEVTELTLYTGCKTTPAIVADMESTDLERCITGEALFGVSCRCHIGVAVLLDDTVFIRLAGGDADADVRHAGVTW